MCGLKEYNEGLKQGAMGGTKVRLDREATDPRAPSLCLPSPPLWASAISHAAECQLLTQRAIRLLDSPRFSSSVPVSKTPGKSSDLPSLGQASPLGQSTATKRVKSCKNMAAHSNHMAWTWGKGKGKLLPKRRVTYVHRQREKQPVLAHCFQEWKPTRLLSKEERDASLKLHRSEIPLRIWDSDHLWHFNSV